MNAATHKAQGNAKVPMLYMALELSTRVPRTETQDIAAAIKSRHPSESRARLVCANPANAR